MQKVYGLFSNLKEYMEYNWNEFLFSNGSGVCNWCIKFVKVRDNCAFVVSIVGFM